MNTDLLFKLFQIVVLLFALSLHECAHAWMASRLGDQTARMLGRVTLNPMKHIDPVGTILFPLIAMFTGFPLIGWARPTPVNTRNFKQFVRDDILVTLAGPVSNVLAAIASLVVLVLLARTSPAGGQVVRAIAGGGMLGEPNPVLFPLVVIFYFGIVLNLFLAAFNLLPLPPLDGSHIFRHMLPYGWLRYYDQLGIFSLILMMLVGGRVVHLLVDPALRLFNGVLLAL